MLNERKSLDVRATGLFRDSWDRGRDFYVYDFREKLDAVAKALGPNTRTRFNLEDKCAELYDEFGQLARVSVQGNDGVVPSDALVVSRQTLPEATEELLKKSLEPLRVRFEVCS
ncbi:MAG: hypothetical protein NUV60_01290 [Patescibacteria group bacterium]|nr:hypothetical protein [Patescibacteria group bacterium]